MLKRKKRVFGFIFMLCVLGAGCFGAYPFALEYIHADTQNRHAYDYFGDQLDHDASKFYQALEDMETGGIFAQGTGEVDILDYGFTDDQIQAFLNGDETLGEEFQKACDAYLYDHDEIFYVDFSNVLLQVSKHQGVYHAYITNPQGQTFLKDGVQREDVSAMHSQQEERIDGYLAKVDLNASSVEQVREVHDLMLANIEYYYPQDETKRTHIFDSYGALVEGKAVCEGYARGFKLLMDRLGIPCVSVLGSAHSGSAVESHMWNYVLIDGTWYGVDVTWDDTALNVASDTYFLKGGDTLNQDHFAESIGSSGYQFAYPQLSEYAYHAPSVLSKTRMQSVPAQEEAAAVEMSEVQPAPVEVQSVEPSAIEPALETTDHVETVANEVQADIVEETISAPVMVNNSIHDETSKIKLSGSLLEGSSLKIENSISDKAKKAFKEQMKQGKLLAVYDVSLNKEDAFEGTLTLTFPVDIKYNGEMLQVYHYVNDKVEVHNVTAHDGFVSISVDHLSPFALIDTKEYAIEESATFMSGSQTQDSETRYVWILCATCASIAMLMSAAFILRRRKQHSL